MLNHLKFLSLLLAFRSTAWVETIRLWVADFIFSRHFICCIFTLCSLYTAVSAERRSDGIFLEFSMWDPVARDHSLVDPLEAHLTQHHAHLAVKEKCLTM